MKGDELIGEIMRRISEATAPRVGKLYVTDLMAFARTEGKRIILEVAKEHGLDVDALKALPPHDLLIVREMEDDPTGIKVSLSSTLRAMATE